MNISKLPYSFVLKSFVLRYVKEEYKICGCAIKTWIHMFAVCVCVWKRQE